MILVTQTGNGLVSNLYSADSSLASRIINENQSVAAIKQYRKKVCDPCFNMLKNNELKALASSPTSRIQARELLKIFELNNMSADFLDMEKNFLENDQLIDFYKEALIYAGNKIYKNERVVFTHTTVTAAPQVKKTAEKSVTYNGFISFIQANIPNISEYDAVILTIPDQQLNWSDSYIDNSHHALKLYEDKINNSKDVFKTISEILSDSESNFIDSSIVSYFTDDAYLRKTVRRLFTYQNHTYIGNVLKSLTNTQNDTKASYSILFNILEAICKLDGYAEGHDVVKLKHFLENQPLANELFPKQINAEFEKLCICFYKVTVKTLLHELTGKETDFDLTPIHIGDEDYQSYSRIKEQIRNADSIADKLSGYNRLQGFLEGKPDELINRVCNDIYIKFFQLVNDDATQDILDRLFDTNVEKDEFYAFFEMVYDNVKYKLYRSYHSINDNAGLMRNCIADKQIVQQFIKGNMKSLTFSRRKNDATVKSFTLRLATSDDVEKILLLNNPPIPYRRAIYVKSEKNEITDAIRARSVWVIEENLNKGNVNLACVAVILRYKNNQRMKIYNTDSLNEEFESIHFQEKQHNFSYLDLDSVLVNDGRSGLNNISYRGYGFQRLFLVMAEEIAKAEECDYICATVSTLNKPSSRNFILNGYVLKAHKAYVMRDGESDYYKYLSEHPTEMEGYIGIVENELEMFKSKQIFDELQIDEKAYMEDRDVPRDFVVLELS